MISPLSWTPIAVALFGIGSQPVIFLVAAAAVWPVLLNTVAGMQRVSNNSPPWCFRLCGATFRTACGWRWASVGWFWYRPRCSVCVRVWGIRFSTRDQLAYDQVVAVIAVIGVLGYLLNVAARVLLSPIRAR